MDRGREERGGEVEERGRGERRREGRGGEGLPGRRKGSLLRAKNAVAFPGGLRKERGKEGERDPGVSDTLNRNIVSANTLY